MHHLSGSERCLQKFEDHPLLSDSIRDVEVLPFTEFVVTLLSWIGRLMVNCGVWQLILYYLTLNYLVLFLILRRNLDAL